MSERRFWIGVVARSRVAAAVDGGFVQLSQGRASPLERMREGDGFACYSPRADHPVGAPVQAFTAIGRIANGAVYQVDEAAGERVFRRTVDYLEARVAPIRPLIDRLTFIRSKTHWGAAFRFGFVRVPPADFVTIAQAMGRDFAADFAC